MQYLSANVTDINANRSVSHFMNPWDTELSHPKAMSSTLLRDGLATRPNFLQALS